jgi:hypothetical protein
MESHCDFVLGDGDVGGHVDEIAEDLARARLFWVARAGPGRGAAKNSGSA